MSSTRRDDHIRDYEAVEQPDGSWLHKHDGEIFWYDEDGAIHREDAPAIIYPSGNVEWFIHGVEYLFDDWIKESNNTDETKMLLRLQYA
jgi:hypothetical protein